MNVDAFSKEQILAILAAAHARKRDHWLLLLVAYLHGLRASEVIRIKAADVQDGYLTVKREKGSLETVQPLLESVNPLLNERSAVIELALKSGAWLPLFNVTRQTVWRVIQAYGEAAGVPRHLCHPHNLKHSCGTHMYQKTHSLPLVQKWLGHVSGSSTMVYLNTTQSEASQAAKNALCD